MKFACFTIAAMFAATAFANSYSDEYLPPPPVRSSATMQSFDGPATPCAPVATYAAPPACSPPTLMPMATMPQAPACGPAMTYQAPMQTCTTCTTQTATVVSSEAARVRIHPLERVVARLDEALKRSQERRASRRTERTTTVSSPCTTTVSQNVGACGPVQMANPGCGCH
jgi:hypothetical protein